MIERRKILIFSECFPPAYKGGGVIQSMKNIVKSFEEDFDFYVVTLNHEHRNPEDLLQGVKTDEWNSYSKSRVFYSSESNMSFSFLKHIILEIKPDVIYVNGFHEWYFVILPIWLAKKYNIKLIQAPRGLLHPGAMKLKSFKKNLFLIIFKLFRLHVNTHWHATDIQEREDIVTYFSKESTISTVSVVEDVPDSLSIPPLTIIKERGKQLKLVTISLVTPKKNHIYALDILSRMSIDISYDIYGPMYDKKYWEKCEKLISNLPKNITVTYKGPVEQPKIKDILPQYHFFIMPTLGENFGHVIYESLSVGRPVLISDQTPWRKLSDDFAGFDVPLSEPEKYKEILLFINNMDQQEYDQWMYGAWNTARNFINESSFDQQYHELFS